MHEPPLADRVESLAYWHGRRALLPSYRLGEDDRAAHAALPRLDHPFCLPSGTPLRTRADAALPRLDHPPCLASGAPLRTRADAALPRLDHPPCLPSGAPLRTRADAALPRLDHPLCLASGAPLRTRADAALLVARARCRSYGRRARNGAVALAAVAGAWFAAFEGLLHAL